MRRFVQERFIDEFVVAKSPRLAGGRRVAGTGRRAECLGRLAELFRCTRPRRTASTSLRSPRAWSTTASKRSTSSISSPATCGPRVINPKTGKFNAFFTRNIAADFGGAGRSSGYLMVTGFGRHAARPRELPVRQEHRLRRRGQHRPGGRLHDSLELERCRRPASRSTANSSRSTSAQFRTAFVRDEQ